MIEQPIWFGWNHGMEWNHIPSGMANSDPSHKTKSFFFFFNLRTDYIPPNAALAAENINNGGTCGNKRLVRILK